MTFGFVGIGMGMVGTFDIDPVGVLIGRGLLWFARGALPLLKLKRLLWDCDAMRVREGWSSSEGEA